MKPTKSFVLAFLVLSLGWLICHSAMGDPPDSDVSAVLPSTIAISSAMTSKDHNAAITAAWARVLSASGAEMTRDIYRPMHRLPSSSLNRFFGFIDGRLRILSPPTWQASIESAELLTNGLARITIAAPSTWTSLNNNAGQGLHMTRQGTRLRLSRRTGNIGSVGVPGSVLLPEDFSRELLEKASHGELPVTDALFAGSSLVVAVVNAELPESRIYCFSISEPSSPENVWVTDALAFGSEGYQGNTNWFTELRFYQDDIYAFSCSDEQATIHQVNLRNGQLKKIFSTATVFETRGTKMPPH